MQVRIETMLQFISARSYKSNNAQKRMQVINTSAYDLK